MRGSLLFFVIPSNYYYYHYYYFYNIIIGFLCTYKYIYILKKEEKKRKKDGKEEKVRWANGMARKKEDNPTGLLVCSKAQNIISPFFNFLSFVCLFVLFLLHFNALFV